MIFPYWTIVYIIIMILNRVEFEPSWILNEPSHVIPWTIWYSKNTIQNMCLWNVNTDATFLRINVKQLDVDEFPFMLTLLLMPWNKNFGFCCYLDVINWNQQYHLMRCKLLLEPLKVLESVETNSNLI